MSAIVVSNKAIYILEYILYKNVFCFSSFKEDVTPCKIVLESNITIRFEMYLPTVCLVIYTMHIRMYACTYESIWSRRFIKIQRILKSLL